MAIFPQILYISYVLNTYILLFKTFRIFANRTAVDKAQRTFTLPVHLFILF